jgi:lysylphosphatidylglycerol synthetase-like protein (DUF2156 family)
MRKSSFGSVARAKHDKKPIGRHQPTKGDPIMANRAEAAAPTHHHLNGFAQIMERISLAIMGALCGLFVAAVVAKADIEEINSLGALFSAVLYGALGFYLGTNIPSLSSSRTISSTGSGPRTIALASAIGTFVAAFAALVSVYTIIFDQTPPAMWNVGIGSGWAVGVLLQLAAGTAARLGQYSSAPARAPGSRQAG